MDKKNELKEVLSSLEEGFQECNTFIEKKILKVSRNIMRATIFPLYFEPIELTTRTNDKYLIYFYALTRKDYLQPFSVIINYTVKDNGYLASMINMGSYGLNVRMYEPSVFKSFKDFYFDGEISDLDVLKEYFKTNYANFAATEDNVVFMKCEDGLLEGKVINPDFKIFSKFTPNDLIKPESRVLAAVLDLKLEEHTSRKKQGLI